ncbi:hypothetical protein P692DRAFT_20875537 [Suillus brevipes Sb2]|nr:hypothetical protein P692DRAFT_20875537 [Suillus brevipes Sb2]
MFHWSDPDEEGMAASASQSSDGNPQGRSYLSKLDITAQTLIVFCPLVVVLDSIADIHLTGSGVPSLILRDLSEFSPLAFLTDPSRPDSPLTDTANVSDNSQDAHKFKDAFTLRTIN